MRGGKGQAASVTSITACRLQRPRSESPSSRTGHCTGEGLEVGGPEGGGRLKWGTTSPREGCCGRSDPNGGSQQTRAAAADPPSARPPLGFSAPRSLSSGLLIPFSPIIMF